MRYQKLRSFNRTKVECKLKKDLAVKLGHNLTLIELK